MDVKEILQRIQEISEGDFNTEVSEEFNTLVSEFYKVLNEEERLQSIAASKEEEDTNEYQVSDKMKDEFYQYGDVFRAKKKAYFDGVKKEQEENASKKKSILSELQGIVQNEERIGLAINTFKELNEKWNAVGAVARGKAQEYNAEFSRLRDELFYNVNIYRELRENDLKKNLQLKLDKLEELKELLKKDRIKEVEVDLKKHEYEWSKIGPTFTEEWEKIKDDYWGLVNQVYSKIKDHYENQRQKFSENFEKKQEVVERILAFDFSDIEDHKGWQKASEKIKEIQAEWKAVGPVPKAQADQAWKAFRDASDRFFNKREEFFEEQRKVFTDARTKKEDIINQLKELKGSEDWQGTAAKIKKLQKEYKEAGFAGPFKDQKLWKAFRGYCDDFFNARDKFYSAKDEEYVVNLEKKKTFITEFAAKELDYSDAENVLTAVAGASAEFEAIGLVPRDEKDAINKAWKEAVDHHLEKIQIEGGDKETMMFQIKLNSLKAAPNGETLLAKERDAIRKNIKAYQDEIKLLENNLGFFANSKGADSIKKEVEGKISALEGKIKSEKSKFQYFPN